MYLPLEAKAWIDDMGFLYVGPLAGSPPGKPLVRFDGIDVEYDPRWTWTGIHYGELVAYPIEKANELICWSVDSEMETNHG